MFSELVGRKGAMLGVLQNFFACAERVRVHFWAIRYSVSMSPISSTTTGTPWTEEGIFFRLSSAIS